MYVTVSTKDFFKNGTGWCRRHDPRPKKQASSFKRQASSAKLFKHQATSVKPQAASVKLQATSGKLPDS
jgi:hypothetical protein